MDHLGLLAAPLVAFGQSFTGGLRGAIRDANGVVRRVAVALTSEATGGVRTAVKRRRRQDDESTR